MATINGTFNSLIGGTISGQVGTPGPQGPAGPTGPTGPAGAAGVGVPAGGLTGQILSKASGTSYDTAWTTLSLTGYATESWVTAGFYPLTGNPSGFLTSAPVTSVAGRTGAITLANTDISGLGTMSTASASNYSTTAVANTLYAPIAAGLPTGGTVGQVLTKQSGTNFDASFQTLIPGDRYLTSSTTSLTINNANKTLTIGTGLSYTPTQNITISYDASNHMHGEVLTYNSGTGVLTVDINNHTGSGTYAAWVVNVGGVTPATSVAWGAITGTLGSQTDLATALNAKLEITTAASTYQTISGMSSYLSKAGNLSGLASTSTARTNLGLGTMATATATDYLSKAGNLSGLADASESRTNLGLGTMATYDDAPSDGYTYGRVNGEWGVAPQVTNNSQLATTVTTEALETIYVGGSNFPRNSIIRMTYGGDATVYLENPGVFIAGDQVLIVNQTSGYITFLDDGSCTVLSPAGPYCVTTNGVVAAVYLGDATWVISGNLQASI